MEKRIFIYALLDPFTGQIRYIGKSERPIQRLKDHCNEKSNCYRSHWIQSVLRRGRRPKIFILQEVPSWASWQACERMWIQYGFDRYWPLTNSTLGGDGVAVFDETVRKKMSAWQVGRKLTAEHKAKVVAKSRGRKHTEEYKQMMRELMKKRVFTPEHRKRLSDARKKIARAPRKLTWDQVLDIKQRLKNGEASKSIAKLFGVNPRTIWQIKSGRAYVGFNPESEISNAS